MEKYFTIGELAESQNISKQTLIHYDRIGLFRPAHVDPHSGYRYYAASQLDTLDAILLYKRAGFSLAQIRAQLADHRLESSLPALERQLAVIDRQLQELSLVRSRLARRLEETAEAARQRGRAEAVFLERAPAQALLCEPVAPPRTLREVSLATKRCYARAFRERLPVYFESGVLVPLERLRAGRYVEAAFAFLPIEGGAERADVKTLPAGPRLCTWHFGDYLSIGAAYERLLAALDARGLTPVSDACEFCLSDAITSADEREYITKICIYVKE